MDLWAALYVSDGMKVLEIGCGDGTLWKENREKLPDEYRDYIVRYIGRNAYGMRDVM